jgi:hypothetical protein
VDQQPQIAQEVMLVPRTVYVPYVAQTPVAPVRLTTVHTVPGRLSTLIEQRSAEVPAAAPPAPPARAEEFAPGEREQFLEQIKQLSEKLSRLEEAQRRASQPVPCPAAPPPCNVPQASAPPLCLPPQTGYPQGGPVAPTPNSPDLSQPVAPLEQLPYPH